MQGQGERGEELEIHTHSCEISYIRAEEGDSAIIPLISNISKASSLSSSLLRSEERE